MVARQDDNSTCKQNMLNVNNIVHQTYTEGPGIRCCIWLQGCSIHCKGCFAKDKWSFEERHLMSPIDIINSIQPVEEGITVLGGEPFEQKEYLAELVELAWSKGLSTVIFTGYTLEELQALKDKYVNRILAHTDLLIDGPFDSAQVSTLQPLIGSSNQRFRFLTDRYSLTDIKPNKLEIRVKANGVLSINGMSDNDIIQQIKNL